jgi:hypothetical protein
MYYIYWRHNPHFMWIQQGQMIPLYVGAEVEAIQVARTRRIGTVVILKSDQIMPNTLWVLRPKKPARIAFYKPCKALCEDYKRIKQGGKAKYIKHNVKQLELFGT